MINIKNISDSLNSNIKECPLCFKTTLWVKDNYFKCFKPSCNAQGNEIKYVMLSASLNFKDAFDVIKSYYPEYTSEYIKPAFTNNQRIRREHLNIIYNVCKQYKQHKPAIDYLQSRGLDPSSLDYGYWPSGLNNKNNIIQLNSGLTKDKIINLKLANEHGNEIFSNRIIFPIRNINGDIIYFQGRSLCENSTLRWLTSSNDCKDEESVFNYFYNTDVLKDNPETLFVCEGISDALSLQSLGLNVVSSLNLYPPLFKYKNSLANCKYLIAFYDNDKYNNGYNYKSWDSVLDKLIELKFVLPELNICCLMPPELTGITDINEWLMNIQFDKEIAANYIKHNTVSLESFLITKFLIERKDSIFKLISNCLNETDKSFYKKQLEYEVNKQCKGWIEFVTQ